MTYSVTVITEEGLTIQDMEIQEIVTLLKHITTEETITIEICQ